MKKDKYNSMMRSSYDRKDLGKGVRGKYYKKYTESHNIVLLNPEILKFFPNEKAINDALLSLIKIAKASVTMNNKK